MLYLLDTDTCSCAIRYANATLDARLAAADHFAQLRARLERDGTPIGILDTMIAGQALALKATLVTNNRKHLKKVNALKVENRVEEAPGSLTLMICGGLQ